MTCCELCVFVVMLTVCVVYASFGSSMIPNIVGCVFMRSVVLFISICRLVLYAVGSGVNSVHVDLSALNMRLLYFPM